MRCCDACLKLVLLHLVLTAAMTVPGIVNWDDVDVTKTLWLREGRECATYPAAAAAAAAAVAAAAAAAAAQAEFPTQQYHQKDTALVQQQCRSRWARPTTFLVLSTTVVHMSVPHRPAGLPANNMSAILILIERASSAFLLPSPPVASCPFITGDHS